MLSKPYKAHRITNVACSSHGFAAAVAVSRAAASPLHAAPLTATPRSAPLGKQPWGAGACNSLLKDNVTTSSVSSLHRHSPPLMLACCGRGAATTQARQLCHHALAPPNLRCSQQRWLLSCHAQQQSAASGITTSSGSSDAWPSGRTLDTSSSSTSTSTDGEDDAGETDPVVQGVLARLRQGTLPPEGLPPPGTEVSAATWQRGRHGMVQCMARHPNQTASCTCTLNPPTHERV